MAHDHIKASSSRFRKGKSPPLHQISLVIESSRFRSAPPSLTYWLHQLLGGSLLGLAQAATENGQQVKPDIRVVAEYIAQYTAEFP